MNVDKPMTQAAFGALVGITQQTVSDLLNQGALARGASGEDWLRAYCSRLREQAAGRQGKTDGLDLVVERAALARAQREAQEMKNAETRGELVRVDAVRNEAIKIAVATRNRLLEIPARCTAVLAATNDAQEVGRLLEAEILTALTELSRGDAFER